MGTRVALLASALFAGGCVPELAVGDGVIECTTSDDCPLDYKCLPPGECRPPGYPADLLPELAVAFVAPESGARDVSVSTVILVVFSASVDAESLAGRVQLTGGGRTILLTAQATDLARNSFRFGPAGLSELTSYTMSIAEGVAPAKPTHRPLSSPFSLSFTTGVAPDTDPPKDVREVVVDWEGTHQAELRWKRPAEPDPTFAGVLILRRAGARVDGVPLARTSYAVGATIGQSEVIASTRNESWTDITRAGGPHDYAFFAFDEENNYSGGVRTPFVTLETLTWCPDETGTFGLTSDDAGTSELEVFPSSCDVGSGTRFSGPALGDAPVAFGVSSVFSLKSRLCVRAWAHNQHGSSVGLARELWISPRLLDLFPVLDIGAPAAASVTFAPDGWTEFEARIDTDRGPGTVFDGPIIAAAAPPIRFAVTDVGDYAIQVRPKRASCPAGDWATSNTFRAGRAVYVSDLGDDTDTGLDAAHPVKTITRGITVATTGGTAPGTQVYVAAGSYPEQVVMKPGVSVRGGFDTGFARQEPAVQVSRIAPRYPDQPTLSPLGDYYAVAFLDPAIDEATLLEGVTIAPQGMPAHPSQAVLVDQATPTVRRNVILAGASDTAPSDLSTGIEIYRGGGTIVENNLIDGGDGSSKRAGIAAFNARAVVRGNQITGVVGIYTYAAEGEISGNTLAYSGDNLSGAGRVGIDINSNSGAVAIHDNTVGSSQPLSSESIGVNVMDGRAGIRIEGNRINGGRGPISIGVNLDGAAVEVVNNLIHAGDGVTGIGLHCNGGSSVVANNTLFAGQSGRALRSANTCRLTITNNLLFGDGLWTGYEQLREYPVSFHSNAFLFEDPATRPEVVVADPADPQAASPLAVSLARLCANGVPADGNVQVQATRGAVFTDADWHVQGGAGRYDLNRGGWDTSASTCGGTVDAMCATTSGSQGCGAVSRSFDPLETRTPPFSIGAHENDG